METLLKKITLIAVTSIFGLGCGLLQTFISTPTEQAPPAPSQVAQVTPEPRQGVPAPPLSPSPIPTYQVVLPFVPGPGSDLGDHWTLVPQKSSEIDQRLNFSLVIESPQIQPEDGKTAHGFNDAVQTAVDTAIQNTRQGLEDVPSGGFGSFLYITYQVTSAQGWRPGNQPKVNFSEQSELAGGKIVVHAGNDVLAVLLELTSYLGGAHPGSTHVAINYNLTSGKSLELAELFRPGAKYLDAISAYCTAELRQRPGLVFPDFEQGAAPTAQNYAVWSVSPQGLLVTFEEYQVAPYAAGPQYVLVPYSALSDILDPQGPLGSFAR